MRGPASLTVSSYLRMPWQGDTNNMIDRFDVRAHLDHIPDYTPPLLTTMYVSCKAGLPQDTLDPEPCPLPPLARSLTNPPSLFLMPEALGLTSLTPLLPKAPRNRSQTSGNVTTSGTEAWCRTTSPAVSGGAGCGAWGPEAGPPRQGSPRYLLLVALGSVLVCVPSPPFESSFMKLAAGSVELETWRSLPRRPPIPFL